MGHRLLRVNESVKEILSTVITAEGLKDPRVGFVTVTGVETTPDLRHAKVFVSVLGGRAEREATLKALEQSRDGRHRFLKKCVCIQQVLNLGAQYGTGLIVTLQRSNYERPGSVLLGVSKEAFQRYALDQGFGRQAFPDRATYLGILEF